MAKKTRFNTIVEDTMQQTQNFISNDTRELAPRKVSILDLVQQQNKMQDDIDKAPDIIPAPLNNGIIDHIGNLYITSMDIRDILSQAQNNPLVRDNEKANKIVSKMKTKLEKISEAIKSLGSDIDELSVEK